MHRTPHVRETFGLWWLAAVAARVPRHARAQGPSGAGVTGRDASGRKRIPAPFWLASITLLLSGIVVPGWSAAMRGGPEDCAVPGPECHDLYFSAHQDDDLLFMSPDLLESIEAGHTVRTIYLTAGAFLGNQAYADKRAKGEQAAYAFMAGVADDWEETVPSRGITLYTLRAAPRISLMFMGLLDQGLKNLTDLCGPPAPAVTDIYDQRSYTKKRLIATLKRQIRRFRADRIRTLDSTDLFPEHCSANVDASDHTDHYHSALFTLEARAKYNRPHTIEIYRTYNTFTSTDGNLVPVVETLPGGTANVEGDLMLGASTYAKKQDAFVMYANYDAALCEPPCYSLSDIFFPHYSRWVPRQYKFVPVDGTGPLVGLADKCLAATSSAIGAGVYITDCGASPQEWTVSPEGKIIGPGGWCLGVPRNAPDETAVTLQRCRKSQKWNLFSSGQIRGPSIQCLEVQGADPTDGTPVQINACSDVAHQRWALQFGPVTLRSDGADFSDGDVGSAPWYWDTLHLADVNGDGLADACVRRSDGVHCALNDGTGQFLSATLWEGFHSDLNGYGTADYGQTIRFGDVNGDGRADVCARAGGIGAIRCAVADLTGTGFVDNRSWGNGIEFADTAIYHYHTIRLADVNGDGYADVCGRASGVGGGLRCALNSRAGSFDLAASFTASPAQFTDADGWGSPEYFASIQAGDINGDGKDDFCGRNADGIKCVVSNQDGTGFTDVPFSPLTASFDFSDTEGWNFGPFYYRSIRLVDVNGDGYADVCGRRFSGIQCALARPKVFTAKVALMPREFTNDQGWADEKYGATIQFGDINGDGRPDLCGRGPGGMLCGLAPSN